MKKTYTRYVSDLEDVNGRLPKAEEKYNAAVADVYSEDCRKAVLYLNTKVEQYSLMGTYQLVFEAATRDFRDENGIKNIRGKTHRYDLYAQLMFAMKYFGYANGETNFMCVDEGQDLSINEYKLIRELNRGNLVFNVFGDTNQLIKPGRGISDCCRSEIETGNLLFVEGCDCDYAAGLRLRLADGYHLWGETVGLLSVYS